MNYLVVEYNYNQGKEEIGIMFVYYNSCKTVKEIEKLLEKDSLELEKLLENDSLL